MGMTLAQKILARAAGKEFVEPGQFIVPTIDVAMLNDMLAAVYVVLKEAGIKKVWDPDKIVCMIDHASPAPTIQMAEAVRFAEQAVDTLKIRNYYGLQAGICQQVLVDYGHVFPGELIVGTDSHTTIFGALGAAGTGIGIS